MLTKTGAVAIDPTFFVNGAVLLTRPGQAAALQWIVDTGLHGVELAAFHQEVIGEVGAITQHEPGRGAPHGFTELRVPVRDLPAGLIEQLPRRLRAAVTAARA